MPKKYKMLSDGGPYGSSHFGTHGKNPVPDETELTIVRYLVKNGAEVAIKLKS